MSHISYINYKKCCACQIALRNKNIGKNTVRITEKSIEKIKLFFQNSDIKLDDFICSKCRTGVNKSDKSTIDTNENHPQLIRFNSSFAHSKVSMYNDEPYDDKSENSEKRTMKKVELFRAPFSKSNCFVCKKKNGLQDIKPESILSAYKNYALFIQKDCRCCKKHFDSNGDLNYDDFVKISKAPLLVERSPVELIDICLTKAEHLVMQLNNSCGIFDKFRDLAT
jgi:hypothetical protein